MDVWLFLCCACSQDCDRGVILCGSLHTFGQSTTIWVRDLCNAPPEFSRAIVGQELGGEGRGSLLRTPNLRTPRRTKMAPGSNGTGAARMGPQKGTYMYVLFIRGSEPPSRQHRTCKPSTSKGDFLGGIRRKFVSVEWALKTLFDTPPRFRLRFGGRGG